MRTLLASGSMSWTRLDVPGRDSAMVSHTSEGWMLDGTAGFTEEDRPCMLRYRVECDEAWRTLSARVEGHVGPVTVCAELFTEDGRWWLDAVEQPQVAGCVDVDLAFTPATNLLAIRRLGLRVGERAETCAAWLRLPGQPLERLDQRYDRIGEQRYAYQAPGLGFEATLDVDETGFVTRYPGLWEMEG